MASINLVIISHFSFQYKGSFRNMTFAKKLFECAMCGLSGLVCSTDSFLGPFAFIRETKRASLEERKKERARVSESRTRERERATLEMAVPEMKGASNGPFRLTISSLNVRTNSDVHEGVASVCTKYQRGNIY